MIVSTPGALPLLSLFFVIVTEKTLENALGNTCFPVPLADPHSIVSPSEKRFHPLSDKALCSLPLLLLCEDMIIFAIQQSLSEVAYIRKFHIASY